MVILHLIPSIDFGGTERVLLSLAQQQTKKGHTVYVISFTDNNGYLSLSEGLNIINLPAINVLWKRNRTISSNLEKLQEIFDDLHPAIIHSHSYWTELMVYSLPKLKNVTYVSHFHLFYPFYKKFSIFNPSYLGHKFLLKRLLNAYETYNTQFITVSTPCKEFYAKSFSGKLKSKIKIIPNSIDLKVFNAIKEKKTDIGSISLLSVGRLTKEKNYLFLFDVVKKLKVLGLKFIWTIAGEGDLKQELMNLISINHLSNEIKLLGQVSDINNLYTHSDLLLHASKSESFGLVFLEAMASGVPSISLRAGGNEDIITDGVEGFLLPSSSSIDVFSQKVLDIMGDELLYRKLKSNGINKAKEFSLDNYEEQIYSFYLNNV